MRFFSPRKITCVVSLFLCFFFFTLTILTAGATTSNETEYPNNKHVLVINSYHQGYKWSDGLFNSIEEFFNTRSLYNTELHTVYLDSKRIHDKTIWETNIQKYVTQFPPNYFDVIITLDDNAFTTIQDLYQKNQDYRNTPVVFCGVNYLPEETYQKIIGPHSYPLFTGILQDGDYWNTALLATMLDPSLETLFIIYDNSPTGQGVYQDSLRDLQEFTQKTGVELEYLAGTELTNDQLLEALQSLPSNSAVIFNTWQIDANGEYVNKEQFMDIVLHEMKHPWYSINDQSIYPKVVGGSVITAYRHGREVASIAHDILLGKAPSDVKLDHLGQSEFIVNWEALEYWNLNLDLLPAMARIIGQPPSVYEKYGVIIWILGAFLFVSLIALVLLYRYILHNRHQQKMFTIASKRFDSILHVLPVVISVVNKRGKYLVKISEQNSFYDTLLSGMKEETYIHQEHGLMVESKLLPYIQQALYTKEDQMVQYEIARKNKVYCSYLYPVEKELFGEEAVVWVQVDISPQAEQQNNLSNIINQTEQANTTKDLLISYVYQRLQEPLYTIIKNAEIIQRQSPQGLFDKEVRIMQGSSRGLLFVLNNIREYIRLTEKIAPYHLEPIHFESLVNTVHKKYKAKMEDKNILLQKQIPSVLPMFRLDRRRLIQILSNILEAAIERTVHGDITISLQAKPNQHPDYQNLTIRFTDTGQGYSLEQQKVLVRSLQDIQYWLTLPDNERFGLSFMITNKIVQSMGGSLQIESEEYKGTEYTITIPMVEIE